MKTLVLLNPHAQSGGARQLLPALVADLAHHGPKVRCVCHEDWQDSLADIADCPPGSRIVAVGGDGTYQRYLPAVLEGQHSLGIVPCGSGNDLARTLHSDRAWRWRAWLHQAVRGPTREVDVGVAELNERRAFFLSSLAIGFDSAVARRTQHAPAWLGGMPRYLWAMVRELSALRSWTVGIDVDGQPFGPGKVLLASVLNTPTYGGGVRAAPHARIDDGQLDLLVARGMGRTRVLRLAARMARGTHLDLPSVSHTPASRVVLRSRKPIPVAADGNDLGDTDHVVIRRHARRLPLVALVPHLS